MRVSGYFSILVASALAINTLAAPPFLDKVSVRFIVRVCEGGKFEPVMGDEVEAREKECAKPLQGVPLRLSTDQAKTSPVDTDGNGLAIVGPIEIGRDDALRVLMGCTTHQCMTLRLKGVRSGQVREGDNRLLVFTVPNRRESGSEPGAPD